MASAKGRTVRDQKKLTAMKATTTLRSRCSRSTAIAGQRCRVPTNSTLIIAAPVALRHSVALYAPSASASSFIAASISENVPMPTHATRKAMAGLVGAGMVIAAGIGQPTASVTSAILPRRGTNP
jgi:hypothetical protein